MWSVTAVAAFAYIGPGLDVCPPVQENLDGPEVAFPSSPVEGSPSILLETQRDNTSSHVTWKTNTIYTYIVTCIQSFIHVHTNMYKYYKMYVRMHICG